MQPNKYIWRSVKAYALMVIEIELWTCVADIYCIFGVAFISKLFNTYSCWSILLIAVGFGQIVIDTSESFFRNYGLSYLYQLEGIRMKFVGCGSSTA